MEENEKKRTSGKKPVDNRTQEELDAVADRFLWRPEEIVFTYVPGKTPKDKKK